MPKKFSLTLSESVSEISRSFNEWYSALKIEAEEIGSELQIAGTDVRFRRIERHKDRLHLEFWIGSSKSAAVQFGNCRR
jgi:hypothetical protein